MEIVTAEMTVSFNSFSQSFISQVFADRSDLRLHINYIRGPFRYFQSKWSFEANKDGTCTIDFNVDFEFKGKILQTFISSIFGLLVTSMVKAFEDRAQEIYGRTDRVVA